jgi:iron complex transport system substrate-binding protein
MHTTRTFMLLSVFFSIVLLMSGCSSNTAEKTSSAKTQTYTITDQMGRTVTLPEKINRIVCLQHHSLDILAELQAQDKVVGVMNDWDNLLDSSFAKILPGIENMPQPGSLKDASIEEIAALKPDVVIVSNQMPKETVDKLEAMGIPVVAITMYVADKEQASTIHPELTGPDEAYTEGLRQAIQILGKIAGKEQKADALWQYVMKNRQIVSDHLAAVPEEKRIRVYMANENMYTYGTGKYVGSAMARAGAKNVAEALHGYKQVTPEQVAAWNPDVIFVQSRYASILEQIKTSPAWSEINAVKSGRLYMAPDYTKPWGNPTPESIALGEVWLAKTLYPEAFQDIDMEALVEDFYHTFYGISYTS